MKIWLLLITSVTLLAADALAQRSPVLDAPSRRDVFVPPELEPWRDWVLHDHPSLGCPLMAAGNASAGSSLCAWPGALTLAATASGADFEQDWGMYSGGWVALPGNRDQWPSDLSANGKPLSVIERNGAPYAWLTGGEHALKGRIQWQQQPAQLTIPANTGLVNLSVNGRRVDFPRWARGTLWLGRSAQTSTTSEESLRLTVHRLFTDDLPQRLETRIRLEVSGQAREQLLGRALPEGFVPMQLDAPLPLRIEPNGRLRVQLRPGVFELRIGARASVLQDRISLAPGDGDWADQEIWSYQSNDRLRITLAEGDNPVDPTQTGVPGEWHGFAAFRLVPGNALSVIERSRGAAETLDNQLSLNREMWLDFEGDGFTLSDTVSGTMRNGWRLDIEQPYKLMSARQNGRNLLITAGQAATRSGFELRANQLSVNAISRVEEASSRLAATGWQETFDSVNGTVYLPPGYRLLAVSGTDRAPDAWLSQWRLLDYFLVLLTAVAAGKLLGRSFGAVALAVLVLTHGEHGAPVWSWLVLLAGVALVKYSPVGRLKSTVTVLRNLAFAALILIALPFAGNQLRLVIFPQLESAVQVGGSMMDYSSKATSMVRRAPMVAAPEMAAMEDGARAVEEVVVTAQSFDLANAGMRSQYGVDTLLQAGAPIPQWRARQHRFSIAGPVLPEQTVRLWLLNPFVVGAVRALSVLLIALLLWRIASLSFGKLRLPRPPASTAAAIVAVLAIAALAPPPVQAQDMPPEHLLKELEKRLTAPPACMPTCAEWSSAKITVRPDGLAIEMVLDALDHVAAPLPGSLDGWLPQAVTVDGQRVQRLQRQLNDILHVPVPPGRHRVLLIGALPQRDAVSVPFPQPPHHVTVSADGWEVSGVVEARLVSGVLELVRAQAAPAGGGTELEPQQIPPFVSVVRNLQFDVEWQVVTRVTRLAPAQGAFTVTLPLIEGEALVSETLPVTNGTVTAGFSAGQSQVSWRSTLKKTNQITLTARDAADYSEVWSFTISPLWRASFNGVPAAATNSANLGNWQPVYYPRQGEQLQVQLEQPQGLPGNTLAFDSVALATQQGQRNAESTLTLAYRSTRGGRHTIQLPADARVMSVLADGMTLPLRAQDGALTLPIVPGEHELNIVWQQSSAVGTRVKTPAVDLGEAAGNVQISLMLPNDRWPIWTTGPQVGPAVLYWAELLVFLLAALVLSRTDITPLKFHHWLVLGLGFSTYSWEVLVLVVAWLLALGWSARSPAPTNRILFNARQVVLVLFSIITLATLIGSISFALLGRPDLHIQGNGSSMSHLRWFADQVDAVVPSAGAFTLPLWLYKALILVWALWLSFALLRWLQWAWAAWSRDGLWRGRVITAGERPQTDDLK